MWQKLDKYTDIKTGMRLRITTTIPGRPVEVNEVLVLERKRTTLRLQIPGQGNRMEYVTTADWNFSNIWSKVEVYREEVRPKTELDLVEDGKVTALLEHVIAYVQKVQAESGNIDEYHPRQLLDRFIDECIPEQD